MTPADRALVTGLTTRLDVMAETLARIEAALTPPAGDGPKQRRRPGETRKRIMSLKQAAEYTGLPPKVLQGMAQRGQIPTLVLAGAARRIRRYSREDLDALVRKPGR